MQWRVERHGTVPDTTHLDGILEILDMDYTLLKFSHFSKAFDFDSNNSVCVKMMDWPSRLVFRLTARLGTICRPKVSVRTAFGIHRERINSCLFRIPNTSRDRNHQKRSELVWLLEKRLI